MSGLRRRYLSAGHGGRIHLRVGGAGPAVLLLPDTPGSGAALAPLAIDLIDERYAVAVPDLIGAGGTTYHAGHAGDLGAQARLAATTIEQLGWRRAAVVADGAGAAVALRLAADRPELVSGVGVAAPPYADAEPVPAWDATLDEHGEHLVRLWHELRDAQVFAPFWRRTSGTRRHRPMPGASILHDVFADTLPHVPAHRQLAEAARRDWPALVAAATVPVAAATSRQELLACLDGFATDAAPGGPATAHPAVGPAREYVDVGHGQVHVRGCRPHDPTPGTLPVLLLHANPGSAQGLERVLTAVGADRLAVAPDLPGHGRSDPLPPARRDGATLADPYVPVLLEVLDGLGLDRVDVYGTHTGAGLGVELAIAAPHRVRSLVLDGVPLFDDDPALVAAVLDEYFVDLTPDRHGSHLVRAWNVTRDMALWWPWFRHDLGGVRDTEPYPVAMVQRVTADLMCSLPTYHVAYRAAWTWPGSRRLPLVQQPVLVGSTPSDPLRPMTARALALLPDAREALFPPPTRPEAPARLAERVARFTAGVTDAG